MRTLVNYVMAVCLLFIGIQYAIAGIFKVKPQDGEARALVEAMEMGSYQYPGYVVISPTKIYKFEFVHGQLWVSKVRVLPDYLEMPVIWMTDAGRTMMVLPRLADVE